MSLKQYFLCLTVNIRGINTMNEIINIDEKIQIPFSADGEEDAKIQGTIIAQQLEKIGGDNLKIRVDHYCDFPISGDDFVSVKNFSIISG